MKTVEQIIDMSREYTGNKRFDANSGVSQKLFVQALQNAQDALTIAINNAHAKYYKKSEIVSVVNGQLKYDYPSDCLLQIIDTLSYSTRSDAPAASWRPLDKMVDKERVITSVGSAFGYIPENDGVVLNPPLQNGYLKFTYMASPLRVQKKAGQITDVTINAGVLEALEVGTTGSYDEDQINGDFFLCVTDKHGNIKARDIEYTSVEDGVFTMDNFTLAAGETLAVGDFILVGKNTTNVPQFPTLCESYLIKYMNYEMKYGDSSNWAKEYFADLERHFLGLASLFAKRSADISKIPITNTTYL